MAATKNVGGKKGAKGKASEKKPGGGKKGGKGSDKSDTPGRATKKRQ
jgi:hypothetical protein